MTQTTQNYSRLLRTKIDLVLPRLQLAGRQVLAHPQLKSRFVDYLFTLHTMVRASVPLMQAALERSQMLLKDKDKENDPLAAALVGYFKRHIVEERHHDEWLADDCELLGLSRAELATRQPSPFIAASVGSQYYWIEHYHPVALLGYIAVLEGSPPTPNQLEELVNRTGLPRPAFSSLFKHAQLDPYHKQDLNDFIDELPLTEQHFQLLGLSAFQTINFVSQAFDELAARQ